MLWVDKYRPRAVKQIIGQQGDKSNTRKLMKWQRDWEKIGRTHPLNVSTSVFDCQNAFPSRVILKNGRPRSGIPICYLLVNLLIIKTITKFSNVIGYHQPDLSTNGTVYASCL